MYCVYLLPYLLFASPLAACGGRVVFKWIPVLIDHLLNHISDSRLPWGIRPSVRHVVLHPGHYFRLGICPNPSTDCTSGGPAIVFDAHW